MKKASGSERRIFPRKTLIVKKMTLAEISIGEPGVPRMHYVYINDVSEKGIRISTDIPLPSRKVIHLKLHLDTPVLIPAKVQWKKELGISNYTYGLEFTMAAESLQDIAKLMEWATPYFERASFHINSTIHLTTGLREPNDTLYAYIKTISPLRMELTSHRELPENRPFEITFSLAKALTPCVTRVQVLYQKDDSGDDAHPGDEHSLAIILEFLDPEAVKNHLIEALAEYPSM
ncbi:MAG: PilZ domain-containing protein [Candidatus Eremiobacteraeota bacterium]|nr:PilZ domain-containing protein [Candidatus Eremiobacteraeota bacterium]